MTRTRAEWIELGQEAILGVLRTHHAATIRELEARASDRAWGNLGIHVDPDVLTAARRALEAAGAIASTTRMSRGPGPSITTYHLPRTYGRATTIDKVSARKRLLTTRSQGWARSSQKYPRGLIGPAGERALSAALTASAVAGYTPAGSDYRETKTLLGTQVPGALDNAAFLTVPDQHGRPRAFTVPFEVKNIREWVYGYGWELHQLLYKAALLQVANRDEPIVPVLICRKRQESTRRLGMAIGFYSIQYRTQLVTPAPSIPEGRFTEVQTELGYSDLRLTVNPPAVLIKALRESVTRDAAITAQHWADSAPLLIDYFKELRKRNLPLPQRQAIAADLRYTVENELGIRLGGDET